MPQEERPDEARPRRTVESRRQVQLEFADLTGGVDYRSTDGLVALEVTRFTKPLVRQDMAVAAGAAYVTELGTGYDWYVTFDGYPRYADLAQRLYGALHDLETHGLEHWDPSRVRWWAARVPILRDAVAVLDQEKVLDAVARVPQERPARLFVFTSGGWAYGGPDKAVELLEAAIVEDTKHVEKLGASEADERHLWLWTDVATVGDFRRALSPDEERLPTRPPQLPDAITHLWCVDEQHGRGWAWSPDGGWSWVEPAPAD